MNARMRRWWQGDPATPEVTSPDDLDLRRLLERVAPGSETSDLGGCFCVNVRLPEPGLVVRVQPRFVSRQRVLALQDIQLGNIGLTPEIETLYLDFGFAAVRPRIHELAYALAWVILRPDGSGTADTFCWDKVPALVEEYEDAAGTVLTPVERKALTPYIAAVPLYHAATVGFHADPVAQLCDDRDGNAFLRISEWLLANPAAPLG
ncbi:hypothetical protein [Actinopolymorpha sp. B9G3]|uniref:hypothetical protein n=1 Tax=Actinopolymorpha sp. B9G3 TaxID=3158970 RepID=UPI0032D97C1E